MSIEQANKIILEERNASLGRFAMAASLISTAEHDAQVSLLDLVECLRRGNEFKRITAIDEVAALALYRRTGRERRSTFPYEDFITDAEDWLRYLKEHRLI